MADELDSGGSRQSRRVARKCAHISKILMREELKAQVKKVTEILKKCVSNRTEEEQVLLKQSPEIVKNIEKRCRLRQLNKKRKLELEDKSDAMADKCKQLALKILNANHVVFYTGAGISTAASIPDYRGPSGVWTLLEQGIAPKLQDLSDAAPTFTHMAIAALHRADMVKHVVSQNCDGLHLRSGMPQHSLSELHGNMFIEVCHQCESNKQYIRLFDVTERTGVRKHGTGRMCLACGHELHDTIVHFGEKSRGLGAPYNWQEAADVADRADLIVCIGSSLKVLKKYPCLWSMHKPANQRPELAIINLQWTPKDDVASLKINAKCDAVMSQLLELLGLKADPYFLADDPIFRLSIPLRPEEQVTTSKKVLSIPRPVLEPQSNSTESVCRKKLSKRRYSGAVQATTSSSEQFDTSPSKKCKDDLIDSIKMEPIPKEPADHPKDVIVTSLQWLPNRTQFDLTRLGSTAQSATSPIISNHVLPMRKTADIVPATEVSPPSKPHIASDLLPHPEMGHPSVPAARSDLAPRREMLARTMPFALLPEPRPIPSVLSPNSARKLSQRQPNVSKLTPYTSDSMANHSTLTLPLNLCASDQQPRSSQQTILPDNRQLKSPINLPVRSNDDMTRVQLSPRLASVNRRHTDEACGNEAGSWKASTSPIRDSQGNPLLAVRSPNKTSMQSAYTAIKPYQATYSAENTPRKMSKCSIPARSSPGSVQHCASLARPDDGEPSPHKTSQVHAGPEVHVSGSRLDRDYLMNTSESTSDTGAERGTGSPVGRGTDQPSEEGGVSGNGDDRVLEMARFHQTLHMLQLQSQIHMHQQTLTSHLPMEEQERLRQQQDLMRNTLNALLTQQLLKLEQMPAVDGGTVNVPTAEPCCDERDIALRLPPSPHIRPRSPQRSPSPLAVGRADSPAALTETVNPHHYYALANALREPVAFVEPASGRAEPSPQPVDSFSPEVAGSSETNTSSSLSVIYPTIVSALHGSYQYTLPPKPSHSLTLTSSPRHKNPVNQMVTALNCKLDYNSGLDPTKLSPWEWSQMASKGMPLFQLPMPVGMAQALLCERSRQTENEVVMDSTAHQPGDVIPQYAAQHQYISPVSSPTDTPTLSQAGAGHTNMSTTIDSHIEDISADESSGLENQSASVSNDVTTAPGWFGKGWKPKKYRKKFKK